MRPLEAGGGVRKHLPSEVRPLVARAAAAADELGVGIGLVGGPVRDWLLGRPIRDVDLLVEPPEGRRRPAAREVAQAAAGPEDRVVVHRAFGTVRFEQGGARIDLATVRSETYAAPGALPTVGPGSFAQDLARRDFTINALVVPLGRIARQRWPALVAAAGGLADLESRTLRVFHARSFHDDPTRALRAARFLTRLDFRMARGTRTSLRNAIRDGAFGAVAGARYRAEFERLFAEAALGGDPAGSLRWLAEAHVLAALEPGLTVAAPSLAALRRFARGCTQGHDPPWLTGMMLWMAPLPAPLRRRTLARLAVTGRASERIRGYPRLRDRVLRQLAAARGRGAIDALLAPLPGAEWAALRAEAPAPLRRKIDRHDAQDRAVALPVSGDDLVAAGLRGPDVGRALAAIRAGVLDRKVRTAGDALALAREIARKRPRRGRRTSR